ncbi:hypothetical protein HYFRA_00004251 [Hymenoscyphus fraxineus]|uniref:Rhodopsin domain-containing protein n=1 Tax=Hymenoscyphus fraxineus TaxID=746836 RepID=A0A9N9KMY3_9HELO|nr:hypothetical protein HYFRA_00004251 [Hymenoscyphus fraxineus]
MLADTAKDSIIILSILTAFSTLFVALRLTKRKLAKNLGVDDWFLIFALLMIYVQDVGAFLLAIKGGEGKPFATLTPDEVTWLLKMFYWPELGYTILIATIKFSILLSYRRIFGHIQWFKYAVYTLGTLVGVWFIGVFFSVMFQCTPIDKAWFPLKEGHCIDLVPFLWGNSVSNNLLDWMILALPVVPVWRLQMEPVQKSLVLGSFLLGSIACVASLIRAIFTGTVDLSDLSKSVFKASIWTYIEPSIGVIAACLPYLTNMLGYRLRKLLTAMSSVDITSLLRFRSAKSDAQASGFEPGNSKGTRARDQRGYQMQGGTNTTTVKSAGMAPQQESAESLV